MSKRLTKAKLLASGLFKTQKELAEKLDIGEPWVSRWPDNGPIPRVHELALRYELMPDVNWDKIASSRARAA